MNMNRTALACVLLAFLAAVAWAQQRGTAGLYGQITDTQGGVISDTTVILTHVPTNQARTSVTNEEGHYQFRFLPVGEYRLELERTGFSRYQQKGIVLQVNDNLRLDIRLEVGGVATEVTVQAAAIAVETGSPTLKETVDSKRVVDLPLNGRNLADLTLLVPGVQPATGVTGEWDGNAYGPRGIKRFSMNGSRQNNVKFTLDGGDNNDNLFNLNLPFPFPDAVQEFSVQTSNSGVEIGKSSAGAVNIVTKSGTNEFHGSAFWFVRNTEFNANGFFSRAPDRLKRNQTGFTLGGPALKNRLFFFGGYQRTWVRTASGDGQALTMPEPFRRGDFSSLLQRDTPIQILDPLTGQPFPGNGIPQSRLSRAAQELLKFSPLPDPDGFTRFVLVSKEDAHEGVLRGDYRVSDRHTLSGRYFQQDFENPRLLVPDNIHSNRRGIEALSKNATLAHNFVISPHLIMDSHLTMARLVGRRSNDFPKTIADLGVQVNPSSNEISVSINGTSGLGLSTTRPALFTRTNIEFTNSWSLVLGSHTLVWGADLQAQRYDEVNVFNGSGQYQFDGRITGFDQADFILGYLSRFRQSNGEIENRRYHYQGFYFADTFRMRPGLTLSFGLRWDPYTPITDLKDRNIQFRGDEYARGTTSKRFVNAPPGLFFPGDVVAGETIPRGGTEGSLRNFGPRFGFAWDPKGDSKMSIRGGYGLYYDTPIMWLLNNMNAQTPFSFTVQFQGSRSNLIVFDDPYRGHENFNVFPFSGDFDPKTTFQRPFDTTALEKKFLIPYTQNWNLTVERKLGADWLVRLAYVGTKSTHLMADYDQNAPIYDFTKTLPENQDTIDQRRPRRDYQCICTLFTGLNQIYNSFQASVNRRFSRNVSVLGSYTWSKNIDHNSWNDNVLDNLIPNPFNFFFTRGVADNDHPHRLAASFVWDVPNAGRALGSRTVSAALGGWQISGIVTLQSGRPFGISSSGDRAAGAGTPQADLVGNLSLGDGRSRGEQIARYFNTDAVAQPAPGTYGTLGRNVLRGPSFKNTDLSVSRAFPLRFREKARLVFRSEFFNLFNRPQLSIPDNSIGRDSFGRITSVDADPRILQFAFRIEF